jgi:hypothetical protein
MADFESILLGVSFRPSYVRDQQKIFDRSGTETDADERLQKSAMFAITFWLRN